MEKLSVILVKYLVLPGLICWAGYAFLGPRIGKGASDSLPEKSAVDAAAIESPAPVDDPAAIAATDNDPKPDKGAPTEAKKAVTPPTDDKAPAKFDADVPVNSGDKTPTATASSNDPTATVADPDASVVKITRPRIVRKKAPPKPPVDGDAADAAPPTVIHKKSNPEEGPGDDLRKLKTKPKKDPVKEKDPNLPTTPPDDPGTGGGGGTGTGTGTNGSPTGG